MSVPHAETALRAHISVRGAAEAIAFYTAAFGAEEQVRLSGPSDGEIAHAELRIGAAVLMLNDEFPQMEAVGPETLGGTTVALYLPVADCDAALARAEAAGAEITRPATDQFFGERVGQLKDPFGHRWTLAQRIEDVSAEEMQRRWAAMMGG